MTAIRQPRAILLDMHGTLLRQTHWDPAAGTRAVLALAINDHGVSADHINEAVQLLDADLDVRREASMLEASPWAVQRLVYERLRVRFAVSQYEVEATFLRAARCWTPADGIHEALEALHEHGFAMAVISNSAFSSQALSRELQEHELARYFEFVMSSADYVVRKPHPAIFQTAAGKLDISPDQAWYVGDSPHYDVAGAKAAGMTAILYSPCPAVEAGPDPDAVVSSWRTFVELVAGCPMATTFMRS